MKLNELKSETERLEKGCEEQIDLIEDGYGGVDVVNCGDINTYKETGKQIKRLCLTCQAKLSTLIKTSWIFARKELKFSEGQYWRIRHILDFYNFTGSLNTDLNTQDLDLRNQIVELQEIISYCEAKAKEHKIELNSQEKPRSNSRDCELGHDDKSIPDTLRGSEDGE